MRGYSALITLVTVLFILTTSIHIAVLAQSASKQSTIVVDVIGNIDGGMVSLVERAVKSALDNSMSITLIIDSYGGYVASADRIAEILVGSGARCVAYIPPGGKAASAASMVAIACGKIYMGPGSSIGAAKPIPSDEKTVSYVASRFRALAQRAFDDPAKVEIAERFVKESLTLTEREAVSIGIASPASSLEEVLDKEGLVIGSRYSKDFFEGIVSLLSDPLIYSLILTIGVYLILAEIFTTGFQGYAIAGALLILLALYGMSLVPPDLLVITLLLSGVVLTLIEVTTPGFGAFGIAGIVLIAAGISMLILQRPPGTLSLELAGVAALILGFGGLVGFIAYKAGQAVRMKRYKPEELIVGKIGLAKTDIDENTPGVVYVAGEEWTAYSVSGKIPSGSKVVVVSMEGIILKVKKAENG
ncbi:MAG: NfeD family protein [Sulfolobales archaeon]